MTASPLMTRSRLLCDQVAVPLSSSRLLSVKVNVQTAHTWVFLVASSPGVELGLLVKLGEISANRHGGFYGRPIMHDAVRYVARGLH
jgi:hypothetical protein